MKRHTTTVGFESERIIERIVKDGEAVWKLRVLFKQHLQCDCESKSRPPETFV